MKTQSLMIAGTTAALLMIGMPALAKEKGARVNTTQVAEWDAKEKRYQAELRAEANAPGMSRAEYRKVLAVLNARKASEDHEIAQYQQYKMEQKMALAEATASKSYISINGQMPENAAPTRFRGASRSSGFKSAARSLSPVGELSALKSYTSVNGQTRANGVPARFQATSRSSGFRTVSQPSGSGVERIAPYTRISLPREGQKYPDRFARRLAQEEALDQQEATLDRRELLNSQDSADTAELLQGAPFGTPVPGRPGYISSPPSRFHGYIDVRGYKPGTEVTDPFTGERVRVP